MASLKSLACDKFDKIRADVWKFFVFRADAVVKRSHTNRGNMKGYMLAHLFRETAFSDFRVLLHVINNVQVKRIRTAEFRAHVRSVIIIVKNQRMCKNRSGISTSEFKNLCDAPLAN